MSDDNDSVDELAEFRDEWRDVIAGVIARAWVDEVFKAQLLADPQPILHREGLHYPDRYQVEFYEDPSAVPGDWHSVGRGTRAVHRFPIPPVPDELVTNVDALLGMDASGLACCCPCASCTGAVSAESWS